MTKPRALTCPGCRVEQRNEYVPLFHRHGVERTCGRCGQSIEIERTDPLRLSSEPGDCPACAAGEACRIESWLAILRLDEVRRVDRRLAPAAVAAATSAASPTAPFRLSRSLAKDVRGRALPVTAGAVALATATQNDTDELPDNVVRFAPRAR
ncbi:MAG: hypothetical protein HY329_28675 [Chloroflexi bacterium]|nr:hypothetical protein [Chloroflexota bacterium]